MSANTETSSSSSYSESDSRIEIEAYLSYDNKSFDFGADFEYEPPPPATSSLTASSTHTPVIKDHCITARVQIITAQWLAFLIFKIEKWTGISRFQVFCLYSKAIERGWAGGVNKAGGLPCSRR